MPICTAPGLAYERDEENCVVIRKPATPGHENAEPVVLLNHMDMVAVGDGSRPFDPLNDGIEAYVEDGWMKARGTSLFRITYTPNAHHGAKPIEQNHEYKRVLIKSSGTKDVMRCYIHKRRHHALSLGHSEPRKF